MAIMGCSLSRYIIYFKLPSLKKTIYETNCENQHEHAAH